MEIEREKEVASGEISSIDTLTPIVIATTTRTLSDLQARDLSMAQLRATVAKAAYSFGADEQLKEVLVKHLPALCVALAGNGSMRPEKGASTESTQLYEVWTATTREEGAGAREGITATCKGYVVFVPIPYPDPTNHSPEITRLYYRFYTHSVTADRRNGLRANSVVLLFQLTAFNTGLAKMRLGMLKRSEVRKIDSLLTDMLLLESKQ